MDKTYRAGYVDAQRGLPPQSNGAEYVAGYNAAVAEERRSDPFADPQLGPAFSEE